MVSYFLLNKNFILSEEYEIVKDEFLKKERESIENTKKILVHFKNTHKLFVSVSGGKDSEVMKHIVDRAIKELDMDIKYNLIAFNTTNETAETYKFLKHNYGMDKNNIISPEVGYYDWIKNEKNYFIPTIFVRNCCSKYKEGQLSKVMSKDELTCTFLGMRNQESNKRSHYSWNLNESQLKAGKKLNCSKNWERMLPIVEWSDAEVWLYILKENLPINPMYKYGFNRVGCLICPYMNDYEDLLIRAKFPYQWERWCKILKKNYEITNVEKRLKWNFDEYSNGGKWKSGISKEGELISKKATEERIKELAKIKGIDYKVAEKFFDKKCKICGKKLNPTETAINIKMLGDNTSTSNFMCKKHLIKHFELTREDYSKIVKLYIEQNCPLF